MMSAMGEEDPPAEGLVEVLARRFLTTDAARADKVERWHARGGVRRGRTSPTWSTRAPSSSTAGSSRAAQEQRRAAGRPRRRDARRRAHRRDRDRRREAVRGAVLRLPGDGRHAGHARPSQVRPADRAHRRGCACPRSSSPRAAAVVPATPTCRWSPRSTSRPSRSGARSRIRAAHRRGVRALLRRQRGHRRLCRPDASRPRTRTSAWPGRR